MTAIPVPMAPDRPTASARRPWLISLAVATAAHLLALPLLLAARQTAEPPPSPPPLLVDLTPAPAPKPAPEPLPAPAPKPAPKPLPQPKPAPVKPVRKTAPHPAPPTVAAPHPAAPPVPVSPAPADLPAPRPDAPAASAVISAPAAAPAPPPAASGGGPDTFEGRVMAQLHRYKRYPAQARARHQTGTVLLRFVMDRAGHVLETRVEQGCGVAVLDEEAAALPRRAAPLPTPPDSLGGERITLTIPIDFSLTPGS